MTVYGQGVSIPYVYTNLLISRMLMRNESRRYVVPGIYDFLHLEMFEMLKHITWHR